MKKIKSGGEATHEIYVNEEKLKKLLALFDVFKTK